MQGNLWAAVTREKKSKCLLPAGVRAEAQRGFVGDCWGVVKRSAVKEGPGGGNQKWVSVCWGKQLDRLETHRRDKGEGRPWIFFCVAAPSLTRGGPLCQGLVSPQTLWAWKSARKLFSSFWLSLNSQGKRNLWVWCGIKALNLPCKPKQELVRKHDRRTGYWKGRQSAQCRYSSSHRGPWS